MIRSGSGLNGFALIALLASVAAAQERTDIRGIGMARTVNGPSRGIAALGVNPANLGMGGAGMISLNLIPFSFRLGSELIAYNTYNKFFTGVEGPGGTREPRYLSTEDKEEILAAFPGGVAATKFDFELMPAGLAVYHPSFGGIGVAMVEHLGTRLVIPKDYLAVPLYGLDSSGSDYLFDETSVSAWWWRELNVSYGMKLPVSLKKGVEMYAGVGFKYVSGYGMMETSRYHGRIANVREAENQYRAIVSFDYLIRRSGVDMVDPGRENVDFSLFPQPAGTGFGVDLGFVAILDGMQLHLSVTDIGSVSWNTNLVETYGDFNLEITDAFLNSVEDSVQYALRGRNRPGSEFSTVLPTRIRIGIVFAPDSGHLVSWMPAGLVLALDVTQGFNESMGNSVDPRVSIGLEYTGIPVLPIRTGLSIGDDSKLRWAVGTGLEFSAFSFDIATENLGLLFSLSDFDMYSFGMGFRFRF